MCPPVALQSAGDERLIRLRLILREGRSGADKNRDRTAGKNCVRAWMIAQSLGLTLGRRRFNRCDHPLVRVDYINRELFRPGDGGDILQHPAARGELQQQERRVGGSLPTAWFWLVQQTEIEIFGKLAGLDDLQRLANRGPFGAKAGPALRQQVNAAKLLLKARRVPARATLANASHR